MSKAVSTDLTFVEYNPGCGCGPGSQGQPGQPPQVTPVQNTAVTPGYEPVDKSGRCGCCSSYYRSVWDRLCYQLFGYIPAGMDTEQILRGLVIWKDDVVLVDGNLPATFQVTATGERKPLSTDIIYYKEHFYNIGGVTAGASDVYTCTECLPIEASVIEVYKTLVATNSRLEANEIVRRDRANQDHDRAVADHEVASADHQQYGDDHFTAGQDHAGYEADHDRAASDHLAAYGDRSRAAGDHAVAQADHSTAQDDHSRANNDHLRADGDHARAEQDHQAAAKAVLFTPQTLTEEEKAQARENIGVEGTGTDTEAVHYTPQSLTDAQKSQARTNIGAGTYSKPANGIPASDLADGVIPTIPTDMVKYTEQTLTDAQKAQARTNIGATELFWVNYDEGATPKATKTWTDIFNAIQRNAIVLLVEDFYEYSCLGFSLTDYSITFGAVTENKIRYFNVSANDEWTYTETAIEPASNKVTSWQNTPDNDHYPSEKLVKDSLDGKQPIIDASHKLDYSLLSNTPTIPAAQVPSDWNATEGVSRILNKPTVPTQYAGSPTAGGFANKAVAIPFGSVDADSTATDIKATVDNFPTTLTDGVCAYIRNDVIASASGFTLNINGTGAKPVYQTLSDASRVTTVFSAAVTYLFIYNSTRVEGGCWDIYYGYNANDNTIGYILRTNYMSMPVTSACYRYRLLFTSANGNSFVPANSSSSTNATAKRDTTQTPIDPFGSIRYYNYTSAVSSGARPGVAYLCEQYQVTLGYSFNRTGAALTLTSWKPVYIKCAPQTDGSAIIDADNPYVQDLPTTADGKIYIFLGVATSATQVEVVFHHPVYYNDGTGVRLWTGIGIDSTPTQNSKNLVTSGGIYDAIQNAGGGGGGTKTLKMKGTASFYFDGADVRSVKNDTLFYFSMETLEMIYGDGYIYGTALFVTGSQYVSFFEIRSYDETKMNSEILKFSLQSPTGNVLSIEFSGRTFTYNSATDRYEAPTS